MKSDITFDERYRTLSDTGISTLQASANSRRAALLGLVNSGTIAQSVIAELGSQLSETEQEPSVLLEVVEAEIIRRTDNSSESDLIAIRTMADTPEKATAIANAWAKHYVVQVNTLYGQVPPEVLSSVTSELKNADSEYQAAQETLEQFVANNQVKKLKRLITEKQGIIDSLQLGKQTAIDALVEEETNAQRQVISAYLNSLAQNRLLAFRKNQQAKQDLVTAYIDADTENRLLAIEKEREARVTLFDTFVTAQISSTVGVLTLQIDSDLTALESLYTQRNRLRQYLASARSLQTQINTATVETTATALLLLKAQIFAPISGEDVGDLQLALDTTISSGLTDSDLHTDVAGLEMAIIAQIEMVESEIDVISERITKSNYQVFDEVDAQFIAVSAAISPTSDVETGFQDSSLSPLSQAIVERYTELFDLGGLASFSDTLADDSPLLTELLRIYPDLFELDPLSAQVTVMGYDNPLAIASETQAQALLQLQGLGDVSRYTDSAVGLNEAIEQLETEIQALEAQLEAESSSELRFTQQRDLTWDTFVTLRNKVTELRLERNATDSEVRLAVPAILPSEPLPSISLVRNAALAGAVGLFLGIFIAFLASFMGQEPFLKRWSNEQAPV